MAYFLIKMVTINHWGLWHVLVKSVGNSEVIWIIWRNLKCWTRIHRGASPCNSGTRIISTLTWDSWLSGKYQNVVSFTSILQLQMAQMWKCLPGMVWLISPVGAHGSAPGALFTSRFTWEGCVYMCSPIVLGHWVCSWVFNNLLKNVNQEQWLLQGLWGRKAINHAGRILIYCWMLSPFDVVVY